MTEPAAGQVETGQAGEQPATEQPATEQPATDEPATDEPATTPPGDAIPASADFRMAVVSAVNVDLPNQNPTVILRETESPRRQLSFSIALADGVVLSHAVRRIPTPRPITHELLSSIIQGFDIDVVAVRLVGRQGALYFAELDSAGKGRTRGVFVPALRRLDRGAPPAGTGAHSDRPSSVRRGGRRGSSGRVNAHSPSSNRRRRSSYCSNWAWSAESTEAPPSSEMRMSSAIST